MRRLDPRPFDTRRAALRRAAPARARRAGAATIELAVCLGLLLLLTFGMIEFSYAFYAKAAAQGAAREGARVGIVHGSTAADVNNAVQNYLSLSRLDPAQFAVVMYDYPRTYPASGTVTVVTDPSAVPPGDWLGVTVTATWGTVGNGFRPLGLMSASRKITGACVMMREPDLNTGGTGNGGNTTDDDGDHWGWSPWGWGHWSWDHGDGEKGNGDNGNGNGNYGN